MVGGYHPGRPAEVILPLPEAVTPVANVRSTIVIASIQDTKSDGDYEAYLRAIPEEHRAELLSPVAGTWMPLAVATAHYRACDSLGYPHEKAIARGRRAVDRIGAVSFGTALRALLQTGGTPWTVAAQFPRFWARAYDGGALGLCKLGPKEAYVDVVACALLRIPYYRGALHGLTAGILNVFCTKLYMREERGPAGPDSMRLRAQWV